jgi:hypothetical protein
MKKKKNMKKKKKRKMKKGKNNITIIIIITNIIILVIIILQSIRPCNIGIVGKGVQVITHDLGPRGTKRMDQITWGALAHTLTDT